MRCATVSLRIAFAVQVTLTACALSPGSTQFVLPREDLSRDPSRLRVGEPLFLCGKSFPDGSPPADTLVLADVYFATDSGKMRDIRQPWHLQRIKENGGTVLYTFNFPAYRTVASAKNLAKISDNPWVSVVAVPDPRRYDWYIDVMYRPSVDPDALERKIVALGGRVKYRWPNIRALIAELPTRSLPTLQVEPGLEQARAVVNWGCNRS
jgi:hypothetical protein